MKIGDPKELKKIDGFEEAFIERCQSKCLHHKGFVGPNDKFKFTCRRSNICCKNFTPFDRIILEPYDILRMSRKLGISTGDFLSDYADLTLDENTHFPIALLKYKGSRNRNKCHFLRSYGCSIYPDRPLRCRLYPLGRIFNEGKSYFIQIDHCYRDDSPDDQSWSIREWIENSEAGDYLKYQGFIQEIYISADWEKYKQLEYDAKMAMAETLYDIDRFLDSIPELSRPVEDKDIILSLKYWLEGFLMEKGCLNADYRTKRIIKLIRLPEIPTESNPQKSGRILSKTSVTVDDI